MFKTVNRAVSFTSSDKGRLRLPSTGPELYGSVLNSDATPGLYLLPTSTGSQMTMKIEGVKALSALLINGQYYAINPGDYYYGPTVDVYDMASGQKVDSWTGSSYDYSLNNYGIDVDPVSGDIYGAFYDEDGYQIELAKVAFDGANMSRTETIGTLNQYMSWYGFAFDKDGQLWGISGESYDMAYLYKIDKTTGAMTRVGSTGYVPTANTSACIDHESGVMYWSVATESSYYDVGYLTTVDLSTGKATKIYDYPDDEVVGGMVIPRSTAAAGAPGECVNVKVEFENGSLTGNVSLLTPSTTMDGKPGTGTLTVMVKTADETVAEQVAEWGKPVSVPVTMSAPGMYNFTVYASNEEGDGKATVVNNVFVGPDAPKPTVASLSYEEGVMRLTWTPVTESVNGGWLDLVNLTYTVTRYPDATVVADGLTETEFSEEMAEPDASTQFCYEVVAVCGEMQSAPARSNTVALGSIVPAYTSDFAAFGLEGYTVIDANDDRNSWVLFKNDDGETEVRVKYNSNIDMDDWLITPAIKLEAGMSYKFSVMAHSHSASYPERLEVKYGMSPDVEGMVNVLVPQTEITTKLNKKYEGTIVADQSGKYYIGFHGVSEADNYYLYISEYTVEAGEKLAVPVAPVDLTVTPAADCSPKAEISLFAPSADIYGAELTELDKIEVYRGEELVKTFDQVGPGEELGFTDYVSDNKEYTYTAYAYNSFGKSEPAVASAYIGVRLPGMPQNVKSMRTANVGEVTFTWNPVTVDENGNELNPALVSYIVGVPSDDGFVAISDVLSETTFTYTFVEPGTQELVQAAIFPVTAAGMGTGIYTPLIPAGTPYDTFHESFAMGAPDMLWYVDQSGGGRWGFATNDIGITAPDGDNGMVAMQGNNLDDNADLISGIIDLGAFEYPALSFMIYNQSSSDNSFNSNEIYASIIVDGEQSPVLLYQNTIDGIASSKSWGTVNIDLTPYEGKTIQVMLTVNVKMYSTTLLDNIRIESQEVTYPAPADLQTNDGVNCVNLKWSAPEFDSESPVKEHHLIGYKVYRDDAYILDSHIVDAAHEDYDVEEDKTYTYHVTALYNHGESGPSNKVLHNHTSAIEGVATSEAVAFADGGSIVIANAEGMSVSVSSAAGLTVYEGEGAFRTVIPAQSGVYVVNIDRKTFKLIVK